MIKPEKISICLLLLTTFVAKLEAQKNLQYNLLYQWRSIDYQFPSQAIRDAAIKNRVFIPGNAFPIDIDVYNGVGGPIHFVTTPRFFEGIPITLGTVTSYKTNPNDGYDIAPFPDYSWHQSGNCNGFTSVVRVQVDECNRLWVLDSGVINDIQVCPAKLVIFNLASRSTPPFTHVFHVSLSRYMSLFITPIVDSRQCTNSMVYIADVTGFGIIVYDFKNNRSWRTESQSTHLRPISQYSNFTIAGERFNLMDGVFGMAVSPKTYGNRQLFFHALASAAESRIPLSLLDNPANWPSQNPIMNPNQFVQMGLRETTQTTVQAMDRNGNLFFGTIFPPGIGCWDSDTSYLNSNLKLVARNDVTLQFISGMKVITLSTGTQELWVSSCRFQKIMAGTRNTNEVNYRVHRVPISDLLNGYTKCNGYNLPRY